MCDKIAEIPQPKLVAQFEPEHQSQRHLHAVIDRLVQFESMICKELAAEVDDETPLFEPHDLPMHHKRTPMINARTSADEIILTFASKCISKNPRE
jgi:hypothetical protein